MHNQGIRGRTAFSYENFAAGARVKRIGGQAINCLGGNTDNLPRAQPTREKIKISFCAAESADFGLERHSMKKAGADSSGPKKVAKSLALLGEKHVARVFQRAGDRPLLLGG
jgi:hypothetical protein